MQLQRFIRRKELIIFCLIIAVSAFLRFYKIDQYMTFLGDEGRDAIVVKELLTRGHFPLIGPPTSIGEMYNGPLYYYMMAVAMAFVWLNPLGPALMVALIGTLTVALVYYLGREWFGKSSAIVSSVLYSISPVNIIYSRSSWNPNPAPFFALLVMVGFYHSRKYGNYIWLILSGFSLAFAIQMHYLALILLPIAGLLWIFELIKLRGQRKSPKSFFIYTFFALVVFAALMSPPVIFDFRHDFMNFKAFSKFFLGDRAATVNLNIFNALGRTFPIFTHNLIERYISGENLIFKSLISLGLFIPLFFAAYDLLKKKTVDWPVTVLYVWLFGGLLGLSLYKQTIYDHYLGFLNPAPFLILGSLVRLGKQKYFLLFFVAFTIVAVFVNMARSPLFIPPNNQLKRTQDIAKTVIYEAKDKPFNFALIAEHNYDAAYQYYLDIYGHKPEKVPFNITEQLFVICEDPVCKPVGHPKYEIAAFGWTKIDWEKNVKGVKLYKLSHFRP